MDDWTQVLSKRLTTNARDLALEISAYQMQMEVAVINLLRDNQYMRRNRWKPWKRFPRG